MANRRLRVREQGGFTLIEMLVTLAVLAILAGIAVPAYLAFTGRATDRSVQADLRAAVPSAEAFYEENGTYVGLTATVLRSYDGGLSDRVTVAKGAGKPTLTTYCLTATADGKTWSVSGPGQKAWYRSAKCTGTKVSP